MATNTATDAYRARRDRRVGGDSARTRIRRAAREQFAARIADALTDDEMFRVDGDPYRDGNTCDLCGRKAGRLHDGGCRYSLLWRFHNSDATGWSGWVLEYGNGTRVGYVMRQVVPTPDGMGVRWAPYDRVGRRLPGQMTFPHLGWRAVERDLGIGGSPVIYGTNPDQL